MPESLPERPDLGQLRRRAKELRDAARRGDAGAAQRFSRQDRAGAISLATAQLVIARELGFPSWPRLKAAIDVELASRRDLSAFLAASVDSQSRRASDILRADAAIADRSLLTAVVLGDAASVRQWLDADPAAAVAIDDERGWPPLLYACYSRWHQLDPDRAAGLAEVVRILLAAGASPDTNDGGRVRYRSALRGSVEVNNPEVAALLLDAGANPDPGQPIAEACGHLDGRCLRLLIAHGARIRGTWAIGAAVFNDNALATSLLLDALQASGGPAADEATQELPEAAASASLPVVAALLDAGADVNATDEDGRSALRRAIRAGKDDTAARLRAAGAGDESTAVDLFIGACLRADRRAAEQLVADHPDLQERLTEQDHAAIVDAAASRSAQTIALMLDLGFSAHAVKFGEQPLHTASYQGNATVVRLLLDAGADVDARDARFDSTPLTFATVGSGEQAGEPGDWVQTVRMLIDAGASRAGVWISGKPPSEEVRDLLLDYGITPDEPAEDQANDHADDQPEHPDTAGVMADIARHLEAAYRDRDLDLLASLLHPEVRWTGLCTSSAQVIDWYRGLLADGTVAEVQSTELDRDAVVVGLAVTRQAQGARPAPPQQLYQVFTIDDAQIIEIRAYPDRQSAFTRA